jgi:hypothetical protein
MSTRNKQIYKILFINQGKVFELYARNVYQGNLYGFVEAEELIFGEKTSLVVDPSEERLRNEFTGVKRTFLPMHSVIRIDEVEKEGSSKIRGSGESGDNVAHLPIYSPPKGHRE